MGRNWNLIIDFSSGVMPLLPHNPKAPTHSAGCFQGELVWPERDNGGSCVAERLSLSAPVTVLFMGAVHMRHLT